MRGVDRTRAALALAVVSLAAAAVGALGPADAASHDLLVATAGDARADAAAALVHVAAACPAGAGVDLRFGSRARPHPPSAEPRRRRRSSPRHALRRQRGLAVTRVDDVLTVSVGGQVLARLRAPAGAADGACAFRVRFADGLWAIEGGSEAVRLGGSLERMPVVFGLFSGLDLRSPDAPSVDVTTTAHDTRTTARQTVAWVVATVTLVAALLLLVLPVAPELWVAVRRGPAGAVRHLHLADGVVALTLVGWWIAAPILWDDGWVVARERTFATSGGFSTYYDALGVNLPLDYWVEWLHHWLAEATSSVPLLRAHALIALALSWVLCRWSLRQVTPVPPGRWDPSVWALGSAFLVGAMAWDMTIRPEPVTALLATAVAACAIGFTVRPAVVPLAIAALLSRSPLPHTTPESWP